MKNILVLCLIIFASCNNDATDSTANDTTSSFKEDTTVLDPTRNRSESTPKDTATPVNTDTAAGSNRPR